MNENIDKIIRTVAGFGILVCIILCGSIDSNDVAYLIRTEFLLISLMALLIGILYVNINKISVSSFVLYLKELIIWYRKQR